MFSIEQIIVVVFCIVACGYTSYKSGFDEGGKVTTAVYMAIMSEFLRQKMGDDWVLNTLGKDNNRFARFMETELIPEEEQNDHAA